MTIHQRLRQHLAVRVPPDLPLAPDLPGKNSRYHSQKQKCLYTGALAAALLVLPLPFGLTDPVFSPINYLVTPALVVGRLAVFLVLDLVIEALRKKKKRN